MPREEGERPHLSVVVRNDQPSEGENFEDEKLTGFVPRRKIGRQRLNGARLRMLADGIEIKSGIVAGIVRDLKGKDMLDRDLLRVRLESLIGQAREIADELGVNLGQEMRVGE